MSESKHIHMQHSICSTNGRLLLTIGLNSILLLYLMLHHFLQHANKHYSRRHNQHAADAKHGEILERTTCDHCNTQACGGALEQCTV